MNVQNQNSFETFYNLTCEVAQNVWDSPFSKLSLITGLGLMFIGPMVLVSVPLSGFVGWHRVKMIRLQNQIDINVQKVATENEKENFWTRKKIKVRMKHVKLAANFKKQLHGPICVLDGLFLQAL